MTACGCALAKRGLGQLRLSSTLGRGTVNLRWPAISTHVSNQRCGLVREVHRASSTSRAWKLSMVKQVSVYANQLRYSSNEAAPSGDLFGDTVIVTKACGERVKELRETKGEDMKLRLSVEGGGCSGFQYSFSLDSDPIDEDEDMLFDSAGVKGALVIDETSFEFVRGATIDFEDDMMRTAFAVVNNPNSESACGCGSSFAVQ